MNADDWRDYLTGGGDPYRYERHGEDTPTGRARLKAEGRFADFFPDEVQHHPSIHQQHLERERERHTTG